VRVRHLLVATRPATTSVPWRSEPERGPCGNRGLWGDPPSLPGRGPACRLDALVARVSTPIPDVWRQPHRRRRRSAL